MRSRWERARGRVAWAVVALVVACALASIVASVIFDAALRNEGRPGLAIADGVDVVFVAAILTSSAVATSLLLRRPEHAVGWCFAVLALSIMVAGFGESYGRYGLFVRQGGLPGASVAAMFSSTVFVLWLVSIALVCALTPDGRHLSSGWRCASRTMVAAGAGWFALMLVSTEPFDPPFETVASPWGISGLSLGWLRVVLALITNVLVVASAASLVVRFRRSGGDERKRLLWMAVVAVAFLGLVVTTFVAAVLGNDGVVQIAAAGFVALPPIGAWLAIERYRLYDVDHILSRAVSYLTTSAVVAVTYAAVVVLTTDLIGQTTGRSPVTIVLATLAAVTVFSPVRVAMQDVVDRRFSRRRYDAVRRVGEYLVADPATRGPVEEALRLALDDDTLRVSYLLAASDRWVTEDGLAAEHPDDSWLRVQRGPRTVAAISHHADPSAVEPVCRIAATELENAGLRAAIAEQLQEVRASRRRIAEAQREERSRIERDLHDGAQQRLLGTAAQLQAALLNGDPTRMRAALELGVHECREAVIELRGLVNGLHPSALADGGLAAAIERLPDRFPLRAIVERPRRYRPEVEATLWFVVCEAVVNAVKHAEPSQVEVCLREADGALQLSVEDDGTGGADRNGTGLRSLAERVEAVGGRLRITDRDSRGTRVEAVVPCGS